MFPIYFYAPTEKRKKLLEQDYNQWIPVHSNFTPWIGQTYCNLKKAGFSCEIISEFPKEGIVLADVDTLGNTSKYLGKLMLICAKSDGDHHPSAHIHITHNPLDYQKNRNSVWHSYFLPHWLMPGIINREKERKNLVENIAYIGSKSQLAPEFLSTKWIDSLSSLKCNWIPTFDRKKWNDYSNLDVIVAARSLNGEKYANKGAIKLINAWSAGVPAILTPEIGFMAERKTELDFLVINSLEEAIVAIKKLQNNPQLYADMLENGLERAKEFTMEKTLAAWINFFTNYAFPMYEKYLNLTESQRLWLFWQRFLKLKIERMNDRFKIFKKLIP